MKRKFLSCLKDACHTKDFRMKNALATIFFSFHYRTKLCSSWRALKYVSMINTRMLSGNLWETSAEITLRQEIIQVFLKVFLKKEKKNYMKSEALEIFTAIFFLVFYPKKSILATCKRYELISNEPTNICVVFFFDNFDDNSRFTTNFNLNITSNNFKCLHLAYDSKSHHQIR